ncbi:MAG: DUF5127 domain-containing protein [Dysgonamonadaceae bacterium]|jgi:hypothetical protein|nr:DUF5127 domain-containing protein [Dysgonamonadaceae bacterium]
MRKTIFLLLPLMCFIVASCKKDASQISFIRNELRAPAYPLVTIDPMIYSWLRTDTLYRQTVVYSSGRETPLAGAIRVDGEVYRFMGLNDVPLETLASISHEGEWYGRYTFEQPTEGWQETRFDDSGWAEGEAAFGTREEQNVHTLWLSSDIWVRREIQLDNISSEGKKFILKYSHDDTFELYVNGIMLVKTGFEWYKNVEVEIPQEIIKNAVDGKITIAAHCHNLYGGGLVDFGIYAEHEARSCMERTAVQKSVDVQPTQTKYVFECGNVELKLNFIAPFLMDNLDLMGRPVNYIAYETTSLDGEEHQIEIYFEAYPEWACTKRNRPSQTECYRKDNMLFTKTGSIVQKILDRDAEGWGYFYLNVEEKNATYDVGYPAIMRRAFLETGHLQENAKSEENAVMAISQALGKSKTTSGKISLGYDNVYAIRYFGENIRPYWNRKENKTIEQVFRDANREYRSIAEKCNRLDYEIMAKATELGGKEYAGLCALAYRQTASSYKLVESSEKERMLFGIDMGVADMFFPASPLFLYFNTELVKALMNPVFYYSESGQWKKPYPAHDVGLYPLANGQGFGADLPVEDAGNMLILAAAIATIEGNAGYAAKHWEMLSLWTRYLLETGVYPENQTTSDNFAPSYSQNTNLSVKAILGIASYGRLAAMLKQKESGESYIVKAKEMAKEWEQAANARDHYKMAFGQADSTWSQKYNLIWDKVLNLNIFSPSIAETEIAWYATKLNEYGLPLDGREQYAKTDWSLFTAALASDSASFRKFVVPVYRFMNETTYRDPMPDLYNTDEPTHRMFFARPVVGAAYIRMLEDKLKQAK